MTSKSIYSTKAGGTNGRFTTNPDLSEGPQITNSADILIDEEPYDGDGQHFDVHHKKWEGGVIERAYSGYWDPYFNNYVCDYLRQAPDDPINHLTTLSPNDSSVATTVMVKTSPSRPVVDVPTMVAELGDLPLVIRKLGEGFFKKAAELNLRYHFGIAPLVNDLFRLTDFGTHFDKRVQELERLKNRGLRRTIDIGNFEATDTRVIVAQSVDVFLQNTIYRSTSEKVWGFIEWIPDQTFPKTNDDMRNLARNAVLGLKFDPSTAWNLIPFSWMADWCGNIGEYLLAHRNIVPAIPSQVLVMRTRTTRTWSYQWGPAPWNGVYMSPFLCQQVSKSRRRASPSMNAHMPFLNRRQMSILGSIGTLSGGNRIIHR